MNILRNKKARGTLTIYAVMLAVFVLLYLIIPLPKSTASWISFGFTIVSILFSLYACWVAFRKSIGVMSAFYAFPVFRIGLIYALAQLSAGCIIYAVNYFVFVPYWIALAVSIVFLGFAIVGVIITDNARDTAEAVENQSWESTVTVTQFQINIASIVTACEDAFVKEKLQNLNLAFQYSDPVSSAATTQIESTIEAELKRLKEMILTEAFEDASKKVTSIHSLLEERNNLCKATKYAKN